MHSYSWIWLKISFTLLYLCNPNWLDIPEEDHLIFPFSILANRILQLHVIHCQHWVTCSYNTISFVLVNRLNTTIWRGLVIYLAKVGGENMLNLNLNNVYQFISEKDLHILAINIMKRCSTNHLIRIYTFLKKLFLMNLVGPNTVVDEECTPPHADKLPVLNINTITN